MFWPHPVTMETDRLILLVYKCYRSKSIYLPIVLMKAN